MCSYDILVDTALNCTYMYIYCKCMYVYCKLYIYAEKKSRQRALRSGSVGSGRFIVLRAPYEEHHLQEVVLIKSTGFRNPMLALVFYFVPFRKSY